MGRFSLLPASGAGRRLGRSESASARPFNARLGYRLAVKEPVNFIKPALQFFASEFQHLDIGNHALVIPDHGYVAIRHNIVHRLQYVGVASCLLNCIIKRVTCALSLYQDEWRPLQRAIPIGELNEVSLNALTADTLMQEEPETVSFIDVIVIKSIK
jgi:hypothetical protein